MLRLILVVMTAATVTLVIAAAFFSGSGAVEKVDARALGLFRAGKSEEAIGAWREGLAKHPDSPRLHFGLGTALAVVGARHAVPATEAIEHLETAVRLAPAEPEYRRELAICYLQQGRDGDAERELKAVLARADWFPDAHYYLGRVYEARGDRDAALGEYVRELNVNPCSTFAWAKVQSWEKGPPSTK